MIGLAKACRSRRTRDALIVQLVTLYPLRTVARLAGVPLLTVRRILRQQQQKGA